MINSDKWKLLLILCLLHITEDLGEYQTESSDEESDGNAPIDKLSRESCMSRRSECCAQLDMGDIGTFMKCVPKDKMPEKNEKDPRKLINFISCVVECMYKSKNYIGQGDKLNMTVIKRDAESMFASNTKKQNYYIVMYNYCINQGRTNYNNIKSNPAAKLMLSEACKPHLMLIYLCTTDYHKHHECPYFKWEGKSNTPSESNCAQAQEQCSELDNLSVK